MAQSSEIATWWGRHRLPPERTDLWSLGPLEIMAEHHDTFWRIHWRYVEKTGASDALTAKPMASFRSMGLSANEVSTFTSADQPRSAISPYFAAKTQSVTIPANGPNEDLIFSPVLPEEPLIFSLGAAAVLDPGEHLTTGFLIPLSIRVETASGQSPARGACEIPLFPLIRTWGGTNPLNGELALTPDRAVRIDRWSEFKPRLDVAGLSVTVTNQGSDSVFVDRLMIPCLRLSLFHSPQTGFWCDTLKLEANSDFGGITSIAQTDRSLPREAGTTTLVTHARQLPSESTALKGLANFRSTIGNSVENLFKERG